MTRMVRIVAAAALTLSGLWLGTAQASASSLPTCTIQNPLAVKPATSSYSSDCILRFGNQGAGVSALQKALNQCNNQNVTVDGIFGNQTKTAVINVQRNAGITQDGVYGPDTRDHMTFMYSGNISCF